jgi:hypothetical protein
VFPAPLLFIFAHPYFFITTTGCLYATIAYVTYLVRHPKDADVFAATVALVTGIGFILFSTYLLIALLPFVQELPSVQ